MVAASVSELTPEQLAERARRAKASAREHKRESQRHRLAAQRDMEEYHELERRCREFGITLILE